MRVTESSVAPAGFTAPARWADLHDDCWVIEVSSELDEVIQVARRAARLMKKRYQVFQRGSRHGHRYRLRIYGQDARKAALAWSDLLTEAGWERIFEIALEDHRARVLRVECEACGETGPERQCINPAINAWNRFTRWRRKPAK